MTPRIVIYCPRALEPWAPPSLTTTGIGGSETAVVHIAKHFADAGWRVDVFNEPAHFEGEHEDGVGYWDHKRLGPGESCDVLVSWRAPDVIDLPIEAKARVLWMHDLHAGDQAGPMMARFDRVLGVSQWHANYLRDQYGLPEGTVSFVPNGIDLARFAEPVRKVPFRCVYASSPDRGLDRLLMLWPNVVKAEPEATLHVAYGWDNIDKRIAAGDRGYAAFKARCEALMEHQPSIVWRGRLGQDALARLQQESVAWLYPTLFTEVSCITAMEAMAGGAIPVVSPVAALKETVGEGGLIVTGNPHGRAWGEYFVNVARGVLLEANNQVVYAARARARARDFTWDASFENHWLPMLREVLA